MSVASYSSRLPRRTRRLLLINSLSVWAFIDHRAGERGGCAEGRGRKAESAPRPAPRRPPRALAGRQGSLEGPPRLSPGSRGSRTAGRVQRRPRGSLVSFGETKRKPHIGARRPEAGWGGSLRRGPEAGPEAELNPRLPKVTDTRPPRGGARETAGAARSPDAGAARSGGAEPSARARPAPRRSGWSPAANRRAPGAGPGRGRSGAGPAGSPRGALFTARSRSDPGRRRRELAAGSVGALGCWFLLLSGRPKRAEPEAHPAVGPSGGSRDCGTGPCPSRPSSRSPCSSCGPAPRPGHYPCTTRAGSRRLQLSRGSGSRRGRRGRGGGRPWIATPATSSSGCSLNSAPWRSCSPKVGARRPAGRALPGEGRGVPGLC